MLLKISKFFVYIAIFSVVVVLTSTFFPFIGGKDYFFRFAVEAALVCAVLWWAFQAGPGETKELLRDRIRHPLFIAISVFVLVFLLASLFAYDPHAAFWSNYERGEGGFQMLHYYVFFILLAVFFRSKDDWKRVFQVSIVASLLMVLYGVAALLHIDGFVGAGGGICDRFQGSLGNPAYVAPYLMFSMFYALWLWITGKLNAHRNALYVALLAIFTAFFLLSQTRGAFLGLGVGALVGVAFLAFRLPKGKLRTISAIALVLIVLVGGAAFALRKQNLTLVPGCSSSSRLLDLSTSDQTAQTRFWTWGSAWEGFKARPLLGWGPENFTAVFDKYFDPRHFVPGANTETWFDRAHSVFFDYLSETGILGFLSYVGVFAVVLWLIHKWRDPNEKQKELHIFLKAILFTIVVAYLVQGVAIFDVLPMYINVFLVSAFVLFLTLHESHPPHTERK